MKVFVCRLLVLIVLALPYAQLFSQDFPLADTAHDLHVLYSKEGPALDSITAHLFAGDIERVTGKRPAVITDKSQSTGHLIVIGNITSSLVQQFLGKDTVLTPWLTGKWECFGWKVMANPLQPGTKALIITGSDTRGTAYGVFDLSERMGVSPWYWWVDAPARKLRDGSLFLPTFASLPPTVKFRGIFINDEDWGLQPWAAKTFEPETGDIGPKTYAKVFELLLRMKANLIWPAMHPSTKAFFSYPQNKKIAEAYAIVIGSSHAEPMLRNNVGEWDEKTMGHFNYNTNKEKVYGYWESRVKESTAIDAIYTLGMRGVHDSGMEGINNAKDAVPLLEQIIKDQRGLLAQYRNSDVTKIPQAFTAYKEVLEIYDNGFKLPEDVTIVWPDDNYGYIQRLNNEEEKKRSGGAGVYYHASYWGRPHDYLWLPSADPYLMEAEMRKAYQSGASKIWVLNVGDIKPLEYNTQHFLNLAYEVNTASAFRYFPNDGLSRWLRSIFGWEQLSEMQSVLEEYYRLARERKPEHMGWSRTEPTTQTTHTEYNHFYYGDEAQRRIDQYEALEKEVKRLRAVMQDERAVAFYQVVYYPVMCASWMNKKFLYRDKALYYAKQHRLSARDYATMSAAVYDSIVKETSYYNTVLSGGKWNNMLSMKPRDLPVFKPLVIEPGAIDASAGWGIAPEGWVNKDSSLLGDAGKMQLPAFDNLNRQRYFIDVFLSDSNKVEWKAIASKPWIRLSVNKGVLSAAIRKNQLRLWVDIDWEKATGPLVNESIVFTGGSKKITVALQPRRLQQPIQEGRLYIENNGTVIIHATNYADRRGSFDSFDWDAYSGHGYTGKVLQSSYEKAGKKPLLLDVESIKNRARHAEYDFYTYTAAAPKITVYGIPNHPLNNQFSLRFAISVDDGPLSIVDYKTVGRSEEWKKNVLANRAERTIPLPLLPKGRHKLKLYCIDPAVMIDEIRIDLGGLKKAYSVLPPTTIVNENNSLQQ